VDHESKADQAVRLTALEAENERLRAQLAGRFFQVEASGLLERELGSVLDAFPNLIFLVAPDDRILAFRAGHGAALFLPPASFLGRRFDAVLPAEVAERLRDGIATARQGESMVMVEYQLEMPGGLFHYEARLVPIGLGHVAALVLDITERRRTEAALREKDEQYRRIVETAQEGIWAIGPDGRTIFGNPAMAAMLRVTPEELARSSMYDFMDDEARAVAERNLSRRRAGFADQYDFRYRRKDGTHLWARLVANPLIGPDGRFAGVMALVADVTDQRRAEESLRAREARLRTIVDTEPQCVKLVDATGQVIEMNPAGLAMLEIDAVAEGGDLARFIVEEDRPRFADLHRRVMAGERGDLVFRIVGARGTPRWLETVAVPFRDEERGTTLLLGITRDITRNHDAEARLRVQAELLQTVVDQIPVVVEVLDRAGRVELVNREFERVLGWTLDEVRALARPLTAFFPDPVEREAVRDFLRVAERSWYEFRVQSRSGRLLEMRWAAVQLSDGRRIAIGQDVTEARQLEAQAWRAQRLESIGRLAGGVAHDFNNLLTAILGYAELLGDQLTGNAEAGADLGEIVKAGNRAKELTAQLLAFGRRQTMAPVQLQLNRLVVGMERLLHRLLGEDLELLIDLANDLWPIVADHSQLEQVVMNLALNARDAMPRGGRLTIRTENTTVLATGTDVDPLLGPGRYVRLTVTDTGEGMSEEMLEHVFEPFFTTKETGSGTGLGLATVYGIVKQSGGSIRVASRPGKGSAFVLSFPYAEGATAPAAAPLAEAPGPPGTGRILLVEDDPKVRALAERALVDAGYEVVTAAGGPAALALLPELTEPIDLLVSDVVMPGASGGAVADAFAARFPEARYLFVSGYAGHTIGRHGVIATSASFLPKPFTPASLLTKVREVLTRPADER
jgi:PAS domain S-box-containing protein